MVYWLCRPLMLLFYKLFYPVKVIGKENCIQKGRSLVVCNHLGKSDVLAVGALFKNKSWFLSKKEWFDKKFAAWLFDAENWDYSRSSWESTPTTVPHAWMESSSGMGR